MEFALYIDVHYFCSDQIYYYICFDAAVFFKLLFVISFATDN